MTKNKALGRLLKHYADTRRIAYFQKFKMAC